MDEVSFANLGFLEEQYQRYQTEPDLVEPSWKHFFDGWDLARSLTHSQELSPDLQIYHLINAYRTYGHLKAQLNPLSQEKPAEIPELLLSAHGFKESDLNHLFPTCGFLPKSQASLNEIITALEKTYCGPIGIESMGIRHPQLEAWLQKIIEPNFPIPLSTDDKRVIFEDLNRAELFETFLHTKYVGQKRFSLEGGETFIPMLAFILETAGELGVGDVILGMAHRGRLNVLANILNKSYEQIFLEFEDHYTPDLLEGTGDMKYHKGFTTTVSTKKGHQIALTLSANPSHLESIDPVVEGQARAKQEVQGQGSVLPILVHGDASVAGQGVVYETLQLSKLKGYETGGTLHIVINNQIGFTTLPKDSRSTRYCTEIASAFGAPVFHVNAENPEACVYAAQLAIQVRQKFHCDVFLDLICYRKYGHNESDEPTFTQPLSYQSIRAKKSIRELYLAQLVQEGVLTPGEIEKIETQFRAHLQSALEKISSRSPVQSPAKSSAGVELKLKKKPNEKIFTGVPASTLMELTEEFCRVPEGFNLHPKISRLLEERKKMVTAESARPSIDWAVAEHLAFATLLVEGCHVRISGQDSRRGTFSHRHAMWVDQKVENLRYCPLSHLKERKADFRIFNSPLSEFAVLGFEFGYSLFYPYSLVVWEAQFGDFVNGAQVIIDQYVASSEQKWGHHSGITLLLPHGYEGQGPEHSSARIERFLQLSGNENWFVVNCTTPAQLFHLLRSQANRAQQKPLILFTPKGLLRHPLCLSPLDDFTEGTFQEIIDDTIPHPKRVILCSGKVYYDLLAERKRGDISLVRIEQLYPFPQERMQQLVEKYREVEEWSWVQEEHSNMGAWHYMQPLLTEMVGKKIHYSGRGPSASTAVGSYSLHKEELGQLLQQAYREAYS